MKLKCHQTSGNACEHNPTRNIKHQRDVGNLHFSHCSSLEFVDKRQSAFRVILNGDSTVSLQGVNG